MLAVHWTPVSKTKGILKNGITKSKNGLYCFPLTGHKSLDRWWLYFFNQCRVRQRKQYNGIVFRVKQTDLPAYFGHWVGATTRDTFEKGITTVKQLGIEYRGVILWRLGELLGYQVDLDKGLSNIKNHTDLYLELAEKEILKSTKALVEKMNDLDFMMYALEDYQIVLSKSIPSERIIKVIPQGDEFGRVTRLRKKYGT